MPFCYGGGITTVEQARQIIKLGAEKLAISSAAINNISILSEIGKAVGMQSVVVVIEAKKRSLLSGGGYDIYIKNGKEKTGINIKDYLLEINRIGVGEIVINSIDADGSMLGYDYTLANLARELTDLPITILGGAGSYEDLKNLIKNFKIIGAAAGSLFVFKGKYRAVLISYPSKIEKELIY
jgi:cyclase